MAEREVVGVDRSLLSNGGSVILRWVKAESDVPKILEFSVEVGTEDEVRRMHALADRVEREGGKRPAVNVSIESMADCPPEYLRDNMPMQWYVTLEEGTDPAELMAFLLKAGAAIDAQLEGQSDD